ncbi:Chemotaxis protein methyltransferase CheR [Chitinispirillum alkaliphilum]|nr:Chemotaxis protein methyltransferase CheR [Chitinispirillum alkaliphilum]
MVLDEDLRILRANASFYSNFRLREEDVGNHSLFQIDNGRWNRKELRKTLRSVTVQKESFRELEIRTGPTHAPEQFFSVTARLLQPREKGRLFLLTIEDITDKKITEQRISESEENLWRT